MAFCSGKKGRMYFHPYSLEDHWWAQTTRFGPVYGKGRTHSQGPCPHSQRLLQLRTGALVTSKQCSCMEHVSCRYIRNRAPLMRAIWADRGIQTLLPQLSTLFDSPARLQGLQRKPVKVMLWGDRREVDSPMRKSSPDWEYQRKNNKKEQQNTSQLMPVKMNQWPATFEQRQNCKLSLTTWKNKIEPILFLLRKIALKQAPAQKASAQAAKGWQIYHQQNRLLQQKLDSLQAVMPGLQPGAAFCSKPGGSCCCSPPCDHHVQNGYPLPAAGGTATAPQLFRTAKGCWELFETNLYVRATQLMFSTWWKYEINQILCSKHLLISLDEQKHSFNWNLIAVLVIYWTYVLH